MFLYGVYKKVVHTTVCGYCKIRAPYITCPSCNTFTWHKLCIERICTDFSLNIPDFTAQTWKCPNCWKYKPYYHVIWIICSVVPFEEFSQHLKPIISKGHSSKVFWFFHQIFFFSFQFKRYKSYNHVVNIEFVLLIKPDKTVGADFWFKALKKTFWCLKWPRKPNIVEYSTCVSSFNL